jgi:MFS family permease
MERVRRGFRLARASLEVLRADRGLVLIPLLSFVAIAIVAGIYAGGVWAVTGFHHGTSPAWFIPLYFLASFIAIFSNAAVVATAKLQLEGGHPTLGDGIHLATTKLHKIIGWSLITTTVGLIVRGLENRGGIFGRIVWSIVGMTWSVVTFLVVPVLLFEDLPVTDSIKRSGHLFRQKWGEQLIGNGTIGLAVLLVGLVAVIPVGLLYALAPALGIAAAVVCFGALAAVSAALSGIFNAALYRYATIGEAGGPFSIDDLQGSFQTRTRRGNQGIGGAW